MGMADWGGGVDYSSLFASLGDQFQNQVEQGIAESVAKSEEEQAARDAEKYDQWKNGQIDDQQWLDYLRKRVAHTKGDPKEHQYWMQTLREHESAISDARVESRFELGEISIHRLIAHYQEKMKGVEKSSPAYREAASRYSQLVDYRDQTVGSSSGGSYSSGGSSGGSSSGSRSYWPRGYRPVDGSAGRTGRAGRRGRRGKAQAGPVDPINSLAGFSGFDDYMDGLFGDLDRIDAIMDILEASPGLKTVTDPLTGEQFRVTPDLIHAIDAQYLRTEDMIAAGKWADGDKDGATEAMSARADYIVSRMQPHNTDRAKPVWDEASGTFFATIVAASAIEDPEERARAYQRAAQPMQKVADRIMGVTTKRVTSGFEERAGEVTPTKTTRARVQNALPAESSVDQEMMEDMQATLKLADAFGNPSLSLEQRAQLIGDVIDNRPYNYRLTSEQIQEYADGNSEIGLIGGMETHVARQGLADGTHVFFSDGQSMRVMTPEEIDQATDDGSGNTNWVSTWQKVGGRSQRVFTQIQPVESDFFAYRYSDAAGEDLSGTFVPSSQIDGWSLGQFNQALNSGLISQESVSPGWRSVIMGDGSVWFEDPETRLWYKDRMPIIDQRDRTGGVLIGDDGTMKMTWSRFASAGGVLMPFSGISTQEAQRLVEGDVNSGMVSLDNYGSRDETGEAQYNPPSIQGMYWDVQDGKAMAELYGPAPGREFNDAYHAGLRDPFAGRQEARVRSAAQEWARTLRPDAHGLWRGMGIDPVEYAMEKIDRFGESIGLSMLKGDRRSPMDRHLEFDASNDARSALEARSLQKRQAMPTVAPIRAKLPQRPTPRELVPERPRPAPLPRVAPAPAPSTAARQREGGGQTAPSRRRRRSSSPVSNTSDRTIDRSGTSGGFRETYP